VPQMQRSKLSDNKAQRKTARQRRLCIQVVTAVTDIGDRSLLQRHQPYHALNQ
jgi:hypothetical protein